VGADRDPSSFVEADFESNVPLVLIIAGVPFGEGTHSIAFSPVDSTMRFDATLSRPGAPIRVKAWDRLGQTVEVLLQPDQPDQPAERDGGCSAVPARLRARSQPVLLGLLTLLVLVARRTTGRAAAILHPRDPVKADAAVRERR
jgi:hypothetical protein